MDANRRDFLQRTGAGAAGLGFAALVPQVAAQTAGVAGARRTRRMIVRADDVGHSRVCNIGAFEAIEKGVVTSADVMLDSPGTEDALERLRALPWISVGWHMHMWGAPVLGTREVPSRVRGAGSSPGLQGRSSPGIDVVQEEAVERELRAQLDRCLRILGRVPDSGGGARGSLRVGRAVKQVSDEYGLVYDFASSPATNEKYVEKIAAAQKAGEEWAKHYSATPSPAVTADKKWADRKIITAAGTTAYIDLLTDSISKVEETTIPSCSTRRTGRAS